MMPSDHMKERNRQRTEWLLNRLFSSAKSRETVKHKSK